MPCPLGPFVTEAMRYGEASGTIRHSRALARPVSTQTCSTRPLRFAGGGAISTLLRTLFGEFHTSDPRLKRGAIAQADAVREIFYTGLLTSLEKFIAEGTRNVDRGRSC